MVYRIDQKLVVAVASSALFDLSESHAVFVERGEQAYREYQRQNEAQVLQPGVAFPFIRRLLGLNAVSEGDPPVEVILLSRNDPDTGLRVMNSIESHGLPISRAAFVRGQDPCRYLDPFNASLFLSADESSVSEAIRRGLPAGRVLASDYTDDQGDPGLRIAFDFDGVIADDEAERVFQVGGLAGFQRSESLKALQPHNPGPLKRLLAEIGRLHSLEIERSAVDPTYRPYIRIAIVTSRNAPAHRRLVTTLRDWSITVDEAFFLGGMEKNRVLEVFKPHLFFDDQLTHAGPASGTVPCVHVPFGVTNLREPSSAPDGGGQSASGALVPRLTGDG